MISEAAEMSAAESRPGLSGSRTWRDDPVDHGRHRHLAVQVSPLAIRRLLILGYRRGHKDRNVIFQSRPRM